MNASQDTTEARPRARPSWRRALVAAVLVVAVVFIGLDGSERVRHAAYRQLSIAAYAGDLRTTRLLLALGLEQNRMAVPPLVIAASRGDLEMVRFLVEHGAQADISAKGDGTALGAALEHGHLDIVRYLLAHGAKPPTRGWPPGVDVTR